jgi:hypothetical protein
MDNSVGAKGRAGVVVHYGQHESIQRLPVLRKVVGKKTKTKLLSASQFNGAGGGGRADSYTGAPWLRRARLSAIVTMALAIRVAGIEA